MLSLFTKEATERRPGGKEVGCVALSFLNSLPRRGPSPRRLPDLVGLPALARFPPLPQLRKAAAVGLPLNNVTGQSEEGLSGISESRLLTSFWGAEKKERKGITFSL